MQNTIKRQNILRATKALDIYEAKKITLTEIIIPSLGEFKSHAKLLKLLTGDNIRIGTALDLLSNQYSKSNWNIMKTSLGKEDAGEYPKAIEDTVLIAADKWRKENPDAESIYGKDPIYAELRLFKIFLHLMQTLSEDDYLVTLNVLFGHYQKRENITLFEGYNLIDYGFMQQAAQSWHKEQSFIAYCLKEKVKDPLPRLLKTLSDARKTSKDAHHIEQVQAESGMASLEISTMNLQTIYKGTTYEFPASALSNGGIEKIEAAIHTNDIEQMALLGVETIRDLADEDHKIAGMPSMKTWEENVETYAEYVKKTSPSQRLEKDTYTGAEILDALRNRSTATVPVDTISKAEEEDYISHFYFAEDHLSNLGMLSAVQLRYNTKYPENRKKEMGDIKNYMETGWGNFSNKSKSEFDKYLGILKEIRRNIEDNSPIIGTDQESGETMELPHRPLEHIAQKTELVIDFKKEFAKEFAEEDKVIDKGKVIRGAYRHPREERQHNRINYKAPKDNVILFLDDNDYSFPMKCINERAGRDVFAKRTQDNIRDMNVAAILLLRETQAGILSTKDVPKEDRIFDIGNSRYV